jgi:hypothetical protein
VNLLAARFGLLQGIDPGFIDPNLVGCGFIDTALVNAVIDQRIPSGVQRSLPTG